MYENPLKAIWRSGRASYGGWVTIELYPYVANPDEAASLALQRVRKIIHSL